MHVLTTEGSEHFSFQFGGHRFADLLRNLGRHIFHCKWRCSQNVLKQCQCLKQFNIFGLGFCKCVSTSLSANRNMTGVSKAVVVVFYIHVLSLLEVHTHSFRIIIHYTGLVQSVRAMRIVLSRVPTQIVFSNSLCFPCPTANFPCANLHNL